MKLKNIAESKYPNNLISILEQMKKDEENGFEMYHNFQFDLFPSSLKDYDKTLVDKFNIAIKYMSQYYPMYYDLLMIRFKDLNEYDQVCEIIPLNIKKYSVISYEKKALHHLYQAYRDIDCILNLSVDEDLTTKSMEYIMLKFKVTTKLMNIIIEYSISNPKKLKLLYETSLLSTIYTCGENTTKAVSEICKHIDNNIKKMEFPYNVLAICRLYDIFNISEYDMNDNHIKEAMEKEDFMDCISDICQNETDIDITDNVKESIKGLVEPVIMREFEDIFINGLNIEYVASKYGRNIYSLQCKIYKSIIRIRKYYHTIDIR